MNAGLMAMRLILTGMLVAGSGGLPARGTPRSGPGDMKGEVKPGAGEMVPPAIARRMGDFLEAFNSGDPERILSFYRANASGEFRKRRSDEEHRALYERFRRDMGTLESPELEMTAPGEVTLRATTGDHGDIATLVFTLDPHPPHLIQGFSVSLAPATRADTLPDLVVPGGTGREEFRRRLDAYLSDLTRKDLFSGSVALAKGSDTVFEKAYGLANRETGAPNRIGTMFDLGSITKTFTKVAVGQLIRDGKIGLDDTVLDHIPDYPNPDVGRKVTVRHLLEHTSGLGDIFTDEFLKSRETLLRPRDFFPLFAGGPLSFEPGKGQQYSNAGYVLLGAIVEAASGRPYDAYIEENIFKPAGMTESGFVPRDGSVDNVAVGYTRHGGQGKDGALRPNIDMLPIKGCPAGSSSSSARDLLKYDRALREGLLLGPGWTRWFYTGQVPEAGGPEGEKESGGHQIGFAGGAPGVNTAIEEDEDWTVVVLANMDPPVAMELARKVRKAAHSVSG